jgi:polyisoprenoid-binding protein YceI
MKANLLAAALLLLAPATALAAPWRVLPGSTLGFASSYEGEAFQGKFARFTPRIEFDPKQLATSRFDISIELASADSQNSERDELLQSGEFFNSRKTPQARYLATRFRALGGNRYVAEGTLSLNGASKPVALEFTWTPGVQTVLAGTTTLMRLDFGVGIGEWADTALLPNEVRVQTRLLLAPPAAKGPAVKPPGTPAAKRP